MLYSSKREYNLNITVVSHVSWDGLETDLGLFFDAFDTIFILNCKGEVAEIGHSSWGSTIVSEGLQYFCAPPSHLLIIYFEMHVFQVSLDNFLKLLWGASTGAKTRPRRVDDEIYVISATHPRQQSRRVNYLGNLIDPADIHIHVCRHTWEFPRDQPRTFQEIAYLERALRIRLL